MSSKGGSVVALTGALAVVAVLATPLVPGVPDLDPPPDQGPPPQQPTPAPPASAPSPSAPSAEARRKCKRMAAPWGKDRASGKPTAPFRTPGRLAASLKPGWTGCFRAGTYTQSQVLVKQPRVTLRSAPGERATWRGRVVLAGRGQRLANLVLDGSEGREALPSPTINGPEATISGNDITNPRGICISARRWHGRRPDGFTIEGNRIHDCGRRPPTNHDHGIYVVDAVGGLIRDNVIFRNADRGVQFFPDAHRITVVRNTIDGNGSGVIFSDSSSHNIVRDNLFSNSVERWNAETDELTGTGNRFESNCLKPGNPKDPGYNENGGVALPPIVAQSGNTVVEGEPYRARADGDYTPAGDFCAKRGAQGPARKPR
jgi:parallel beta-helix repeat protein